MQCKHMVDFSPVFSFWFRTVEWLAASQQPGWCLRHEKREGKKSSRKAGSYLTRACVCEREWQREREREREEKSESERESERERERERKKKAK